MTVIRTSHNRENPYVMLNKSVVQNKELSLKAKGLWALLMSYPNDWKFYVKKLIEECKEGRTALYNTIDELISARLMIRIQTFQKDVQGKMCGGGVEYIIFEFPISDEEVERYQIESKNVIKRPHNDCDRNSGFGNSGNRDSENQQLLSNDTIPITEVKNIVVVVGGDSEEKKDETVTKDDVYHYSLTAKTDWGSQEIEDAWKAFKSLTIPITDPYAYIAGIIKKKRVLATHKENSKCPKKSIEKSSKKPLETTKLETSGQGTPINILGKYVGISKIK